MLVVSKTKCGFQNLFNIDIDQHKLKSISESVWCEQRTGYITMIDYKKATFFRTFVSIFTVKGLCQ